MYGSNDKKERDQLWRDLLQIASNNSDPWTILGDFKAILNIEDRIGAPVRLNGVIPMRNCMTACSLFDMKSTGRNNKHEGLDRVFSKIDRVLVNMELVGLFQTLEVQF